MDKNISDMTFSFETTYVSIHVFSSQVDATKGHNIILTFIPKFGIKQLLT